MSDNPEIGSAVAVLASNAVIGNGFIHYSMVLPVLSGAGFTVVPRNPTQAATAIEAELTRQYRASEWEVAKDVLEGVDYCRLVQGVLTAMDAPDV
jgi:hypothetical protein